MSARIWNQDCVSAMVDRLGEASVDLTVSSIPFGALFMYSGKTEDIGNNQDGTDFVGSQFGLHMRFFCEQLLSVQRPGTNVCIHIQQLTTTKVEHGWIGRRDFRGDVIELFSRAGFDWKGEVAIPKNPQAIAQRQKLHSLLFATGYKDARQLAPAVNDHLLIFQRPGEAEPAPALFHPTKNPGGWVSTDEWIKWARGTWDDIREMDVLEGWQGAREQGDEKHVCPLQLEVIRRCVKLYSRPGELVFDPFIGIGSVGYVAIEQGREAAGFELKESYHRLAERNAARAAASENFDQLCLQT